MKLTEQQKQHLNYLRDEAYSNMYSISQDFVGDYSADCSSWICDAFSEYADGAISVYTRDQLNYFSENAEKCEQSLLEMYDRDSLAEIIKSEGLIALEAKAAVCCMYEENYGHLDEDRENILVCLLIDYVLDNDLDIDLDLDDLIYELRQNYLDCDRICDIIEGLRA